MNTRIKELAAMAGFGVDGVITFAEQTRIECLAKLIVQECASIDFYKLAHIGTEDDDNVTQAIKEHFGVKNNERTD